MISPIFAIPTEQRRQLSNTLHESQNLGSAWVRCQITYRKGLIWFSLLVLITLALSYLLWFNHESLLLLHAITFASIIAVVYLMVIITWALSRRQLEFVLLDSTIFQIKNGFVRSRPISDLLDIKFQTTPDHMMAFGALLFRKGHFRFQFRGSDRTKLIGFLNALVVKKNQSTKNGQTDLLENEVGRVSSVKGLLSWAIIIVPLIGLSLLVSSFYSGIIDEQNYELAVKKGTATAFRQYLVDPRNIQFRDEVLNKIKALYDQYIDNMPVAKSKSLSPQPLKTLLIFVRDSSQFDVQVLFESSSELKDTNPNSLKLQSPKFSFDPQHREELESRAIVNIRDAFSSMFPADILSINSGYPETTKAHFRIVYVYRNSDSVYYT